MKLLILGGTVFLGRALVDAALAAGHEVTLFNRGRSNPEVYAELETIVGDRDGDLDKLAGRRWDAVIDTCGYVPRVVKASAEMLADSVDNYVFISSISAYADTAMTGQDESAPVGTLDDESVEDVTGETYGPLKALCEQAATAAMDGRSLIVRSGLLVGPHDPTDRFTYWPVRVARGGEVLAPISAEFPTQFIDARDMADWIIHALEHGTTGTFNVTGPVEPLPLGSLLATAKAVSESDASLMWVDESFLREEEVGFWMELPLVIPGDEYAGFSHFSIAKALAAGLRFRPLTETVADTIAWAQSRPRSYEWRAGLSPEREAELLQKWHAR